MSRQSIPRKGGGRPGAALRGVWEGRGLARLRGRPSRNGADLLEHPERVPVRPLLDDLAALEAGQRLARDHNVPARRRNPHDLASVPTPALPAARDEVAFTDLLADRDLRTLERRAVLVDVVLGTLDPANRLGKCRVIPDVVTAHDL